LALFASLREAFVLKKKPHAKAQSKGAELLLE
jgi:hypothetical protein